MEDIMDKVEELQIEKVCRTCLCESDELSSVFEEDEIAKIEFSQMLKLTFFLESIVPSDEIPDKICSDCKELIKKSYNFKKLIQHSTNVLFGMNKEVSSVLADIPLKKENNLSTEDKDTQTDQTTIYCCEQCQEKFLDHSKLKIHRETHGSEGFKCGRCDKEYTRLTYLQQHIAITHPDYCNLNIDDIPYVNMCMLCNKQFSRKDHLKTHLRNVHKQLTRPTDYDSEMVECKQDSTDENFDSMNLRNEEYFSDNDDQSNPLLDFNPPSVTSQSVKIKSEKGNEDNEEDFDGNAVEFDEDAVIEVSGVHSPMVIIKTEQGEDLVCDVSPFGSPKDDDEKKDKSKNTRIHQCDSCSKTFTRATHLKRHQLTHSGIKNFQCTVCEKRFTRIDHLNLHMLNHAETKPFQCQECQKGFIRMEHLKKHCESKHGSDGAVPKKEMCTICDKGFSSKKYLRVHMKSHSSEKSMTCKFCNKDFSDRAELNEHMKEHQGDKPFLCSECGLRFVRNDYLVIHMRRHLGLKPYKCRFCDKGFPRATDLTVHERYHTNEKTHLCTICGKGFQRAYNLLVHMRVHTGEKPYQCNFCVKSFAQGNDLKAHIRRHTGERFKCDICNDGFIQGYHLTHHKRTVHGLDVKSHIRRVEKFVTTTTSPQEVTDTVVVEETTVKVETEYENREASGSNTLQFVDQ